MAAFAISGGYAANKVTEENWTANPVKTIKNAWGLGYAALMKNPIHNQCDPGSNEKKPTLKTTLAELEIVGQCLKCKCSGAHERDGERCDHRCGQGNPFFDGSPSTCSPGRACSEYGWCHNVEGKIFEISDECSEIKTTFVKSHK